MQECSDFVVTFEPPLVREEGSPTYGIEVVRDGTMIRCELGGKPICDSQAIMLMPYNDEATIERVASFGRAVDVTIRVLRGGAVLHEQSFKPVYKECDQCAGQCCATFLTFSTDGS